MKPKMCTIFPVKDKPEIFQPKRFSTKQMILSWIFGAVFSLIFVTLIMSVSIISNEPEKSDVSIDELDVTHNFQLISREEWIAQQQVEPLNNLILPVKYVLISHTASASCHTKFLCSRRVRHTQAYHIESYRWSDISYNFLVGGDGLAYVGRGWDFEGAHTYHYNNISIGVSFIGTFNNFVPPKRQVEAAQKLIKLGVELGKISEDYKLFGHRQVTKTLSPGDQLFRIIQTWPHWSSQVE